VDFLIRRVGFVVWQAESQKNHLGSHQFLEGGDDWYTAPFACEDRCSTKRRLVSSGCGAHRRCPRIDEYCTNPKQGNHLNRYGRRSRLLQMLSDHAADPLRVLIPAPRRQLILARASAGMTVFIAFADESSPHAVDLQGGSGPDPFDRCESRLAV